MTIDDDMKAIFLLCSLPSPLDTLCTAINNFASDWKLVYNDVTSCPLSKEMRQKTRDSLQHGKACSEVVWSNMIQAKITREIYLSIGQNLVDATRMFNVAIVTNLGT